MKVGTAELVHLLRRRSAGSSRSIRQHVGEAVSLAGGHRRGESAACSWTGSPSHDEVRRAAHHRWAAKCTACGDGQRRDPALGPLQITAGGLLAIGDGDDVKAVRDLSRAHFALYIGGMGAKGRNFYNDVARRSGFEEAAATIQDSTSTARRRRPRRPSPTSCSS